jgi:hypothetical protein
VNLRKHRDLRDDWAIGRSGYTTDKGVRNQTLAMRWLVEGDAPQMVVMCVPE